MFEEKTIELFVEEGPIRSFINLVKQDDDFYRKMVVYLDWFAVNFIHVDVVPDELDGDKIFIDNYCFLVPSGEIIEISNLDVQIKEEVVSVYDVDRRN